ncbi:MAG: hypothetical protein ACMUIG_07200 [Thermoplasmatota archaeon]
MRILHVNNQASVAYMISRAQRKLGHESDLLAVPAASRMPPDFPEPTVKKLFLRLIKLLPKYDLIHVHGGIGISGIGLSPFRAAGKRFFVHYHGSELREGIQTSFHPLAERIFVSTPDLLRYGGNLGGRELIHIPNPVSTEGAAKVDWKQRIDRISGSGPVVISHLPSIRSVKGTENVIRGVGKANSRGAEYELRIIEGRSVEEAMKELSESDICIDWMSPDYDIHGVVSVEAMIRGIPVICNIDRKMYPEDLPIIISKPEDLPDVLTDVWKRRAELPSIGSMSVDYAMRTHHPDRVAGMIEEYL